MNTIKQLIDKYCPDGVEYKKLGEVCNINRGVRVVRKDLQLEGEIPVYQNSLMPLGYFNKSNCPKESVYVISAGAAGDIGYSQIPFWAADDCLFFENLQGLQQKFIYYYLCSRYKFIKAQVRRASVPRLSRTVIENMTIPVPPLPVQREIVRILDSFTSLEAELEAELEARRKQYEYYRDQLLSFKHLSGGGRDEVEWKTLGEVGTFKRGKYFQKSDMQDEGIPCIHYGQIYTYYNTYTDKTIKFVSKEVASKSTLIRPQSIIITLTSENIEDVCKPVAWIGNEDVAISGHSVGLETDMDPKYITYYLESSHFFKEKRKKARGAKVIEIKPEELAKIAIPIPPLSTQRRIVSILDRFESLVNDITTGLPAEITARHQQYEYYRDQLLSFKRKS